jgi:hypothetical protein
MSNEENTLFAGSSPAKRTIFPPEKVQSANLIPLAAVSGKPAQ